MFFAFHVPRWFVSCLYTKCVHTRGGTYILRTSFRRDSFRPIRFLPIRFIVPRSISFRYNSFLLAIVIVVVGYTPSKTSLPLTPPCYLDWEASKSRILLTSLSLFTSTRTHHYNCQGHDQRTFQALARIVAKFRYTVNMGFSHGFTRSPFESFNVISDPSA
jgi:hypothetical protein